MQGSDTAKPGETVALEPASDPAMLSTDAPIRQRIAQGDWAGVKEMCWNLYAETVGRYCMAALGDCELTEKAIAEIWAGMERDLSGLEPSRSIRSVLLGLARRRCARLLEAARKPQGLVTRSVSQTTGSTERSRLPEQARRLLVDLRPSEREILILRYVTQLNYEEIAAIWGVDANDAKLRVSQALVQVTAVAKRQEASHG